MQDKKPALVTQLGLFDTAEPPQGLTDRQKVAIILREFPETRNDDRQLFFHHWRLYDGLNEILSDRQLEAFRLWIAGSATYPSTLCRRRQELAKMAAVGRRAAEDVDPDLHRVALIVETVPEAANPGGTMHLVWHHWILFDGLCYAIPEQETLDSLQVWFLTRATPVETLRRRRQDVQQNSIDEAGRLKPAAPELFRRKSLDGAGAPGRKWGRR
jgi:hypothetical protein